MAVIVWIQTDWKFKNISFQIGVKQSEINITGGNKIQHQVIIQEWSYQEWPSQVQAKIKWDFRELNGWHKIIFYGGVVVFILFFAKETLK